MHHVHVHNDVHLSDNSQLTKTILTGFKVWPLPAVVLLYQKSLSPNSHFMVSLNHEKFSMQGLKKSMPELVDWKCFSIVGKLMVTLLFKLYNRLHNKLYFSSTEIHVDGVSMTHPRDQINPYSLFIIMAIPMGIPQGSWLRHLLPYNNDLMIWWLKAKETKLQGVNYGVTSSFAVSHRYVICCWWDLNGSPQVLKALLQFIHHHEHTSGYPTRIMTVPLLLFNSIGIILMACN